MPIARRILGPLVLVGLAAMPAAADTFARAFFVPNPSPDPRFERFGTALAPVGSLVAVGAASTFVPSLPNDDGGRVDLIDPATGAVVRTFRTPNGQLDNRFGVSVVAVGPYLAVGASYDDTASVDAGAVFIFDAGTGALVHTLVSPGPSTFYSFGRHLAAVGDDVVVQENAVHHRFDAATGALVTTLAIPGVGPTLGVGGALLLGEIGKATLYDASSGAPIRTYARPGGQGSSRAIAAAGGRVLVTYPNDGGDRDGEAYLYDEATGTLLHSFSYPFGPTPTWFSGAQFGWSGVLMGSSALIGASGFGAEEVFVFDAASGALEQILKGTQRPGDEFRLRAFGSEATSAGGSFIAGDPSDGRLKSGAGSIEIFDRCGNGVFVEGEQCDDGNTTSGDGCSATCKLELCPPSPLIGCRQSPSGRSTLRLKDPNSILDAADQLDWKWSRGTATTLADFGTPTTTTAYALCWYRAGALFRQVVAPAGGTCAGRPCWKARSRGFRYRDKRATPNGVLDLSVKAGPAGGASLKLRGQGADLDLPDLNPFGLHPENTMVLQLVNSDTPACWEAVFLPPYNKNTNGELRDRN